MHGKQNHRQDIKRAADLDGFKEPLPSKKPRGRAFEFYCRHQINVRGILLVVER